MLGLAGFAAWKQVTSAARPERYMHIDFSTGHASLRVCLCSSAQVHVEAPTGCAQADLVRIFGCKTVTTRSNVQPGEAALELEAQDKHHMVDVLGWQEQLAKTCRKKKLVLVVKHDWRHGWTTRRYKLADILQPNSRFANSGFAWI